MLSGNAGDSEYSCLYLGRVQKLQRMLFAKYQEIATEKGMFVL